MYGLLIQHILGAFAQSFLPLVIASNLAPILANKIRLQRLSKYTGSIITERPFTNDLSEEERQNAINNVKIQYLLPIIEKLKEYTSEENMKTAYRNLTSIKVKKNPIIIMLGLGGSYNSNKNKISYSLNSALGHEFLHLASAYYDHENKISYVGFEQRKGVAIIGKGLNEGYTELLSSRLYNKKNEIICYKKEAKIARLLEFFFDNPQDMEKFYFNHDLPGFVRHMEQFATRDEVIRFILDIDSLNILSRGFGNPVPTYNSVKAQLTLYNWFAAKNKDPEKLKQFKELVCENKMASIIINKRKMKLYRESPYAKQEQKIDTTGEKLSIEHQTTGNKYMKLFGEYEALITGADDYKTAILNGRADLEDLCWRIGWHPALKPVADDLRNKMNEILGDPDFCQTMDIPVIDSNKLYKYKTYQQIDARIKRKITATLNKK